MLGGTAGVDHVGKGFEAGMEWAEESGDLRGSFVTLLRQRHAHYEDVISAEADILFAEGDEAAHQQPSADE